MPTLGDSFPESSRRTFLEEQFGPGSILYLFCDFTHPPKEKYLAVVSVTPLLVFVVNSSVNQYIKARPHLEVCQVTLANADYAFLSQDSFLNCSQVIDSLRVEDAMNQLMADTSRIPGALDLATVQKVASVVCATGLISTRHRYAIEDALGSCYDLSSS